MVGALADAASALSLTPSLAADVVLLDIELGIRLRRLMPEVGIVLLSNHMTPHLVTALPVDASRGWSFLSKTHLSDVDSSSRAIDRGA